MQLKRRRSRAPGSSPAGPPMGRTGDRDEGLSRRAGARPGLPEPFRFRATPAGARCHRRERLAAGSVPDRASARLPAGAGCAKDARGEGGLTCGPFQRSARWFSSHGPESIRGYIPLRGRPSESCVQLDQMKRGVPSRDASGEQAKLQPLRPTIESCFDARAPKKVR